MIRSYPLERYLRDQAHSRRRHYHPAMHQLRFAPGALDTEVTDETNVDPGHAFLLKRILGFCFDTTTRLAVIPNATVRIRYGGAGGRSFMRDPIAWQNLVGWAPGKAYEMPTPILMPIGSGFFGALIQLSGPVTLSYGIVLQGSLIRKFK
jgi:hypothetical protein